MDAQLRGLAVIRRFLVVASLIASFAQPASADHVAVVVDGDLTDLIDAVNGNLGPAQGGFSIPSVQGNIYTGSCAYVNGFDLRNVYALFDFRAAGGGTAGSMTLYLGWDVFGVIGDVDGDGSADLYTNPTPACANGGDQPGIGSGEAYKFFVDVDCDFNTDVVICVTGNAVVLDGVGPIPGATFARNGSFLEVAVPNYQALLPPGSDPCHARLFMTANATFDGLGEDASIPFELNIPPSVTLSKSPSEQTACPGGEVSWTITVTNDGLCGLDEVTVRDTLGNGLAFVSSFPPSSGDDQVRVWAFPGLSAGEDIEIVLTARLDENCMGPLVNTADVQVAHLSACGGPATATARDAAVVTCRPIPCLIAGDTRACPGSVRTFTFIEKTQSGRQLALINGASQAPGGVAFATQWSVTSTPPGICEVQGPDDGSSIDVLFTAPGQCTVSLTVSDPADPQCSETCSLIVDVDPLPPCDISGPVTAQVGDVLIYTTTAADPLLRQWSASSNPAGICAIQGSDTGPSVQLSFTGAGTCTISLTVADPQDPDVCVSDCELVVTIEEEEQGICLVIIDEDGIDNGHRSVEEAAASHGITPDRLVNDDRPTEVGNPPLRWNTLFPGDIVLLPTGQVKDEGWFALPEVTPWPLADFVAGTVPQSRLDKIPDVMPLRNHDLVRLVGQTCVAVVYDSDVSMNYKPINANLQGARYGLFTFTVLAVEVPGHLPEAGSSTSLYSLWVRVESPLVPTFAFSVPVRHEDPDAAEIKRARYGNGKLVIYGESDYSPGAVMTASVDGPDEGSDLAIDPFLLEEPMAYNAGASRYELIYPTPVNLVGRRVTISTDAAGAYNSAIIQGTTSSSSDEVEVAPVPPVSRLALRVFPNPARGVADFLLHVPESPEDADVAVEVFDVRGSLVRTLSREHRESGQHHLSWNLTGDGGNRVAAGTYIVRITRGSESLTEKVVVLSR